MTEDYAALWDAYDAAVAQAQHGKGAKRHGNGKPWTEQPMFHLIGVHGIGFATGQAEKKIIEAMGMIARGQQGAARAELLGAMNYLAAAVHVIGDVRQCPEGRG